MMNLSNLQPAEGSTHNDFRRGRGHASGNGKTAGKGHKGQKARSGAPRPGFEGGQMPLFRRLPKRGFTNINAKKHITVDLADLNSRFEDGAVITEEAIVESGLVKKVCDGIKVLGNGDVTKKFTLKGLLISEGAKSKVEAAGGTVEE